MLFTPLRLRDLTLRNRIGASPMCQYSSTNGLADDWHLVHLGGLAVGGAGLVLSEAAAVCPEGRISPQDLGIWDDAHVPMLRRITDFVHAQGAASGIQLAHAGRKSSTRRPWEGAGALVPDEGGWREVYAPSDIAFSASYPQPLALTPDGIAQVVDAFRQAARRARSAGFQVVEVHAAHGYLLHEFLSPLSNHRTDAWGGPFEHRIRLVLEVVDAVRSEWPAGMPVFVRISATDWAEGGWTADDAVELSRRIHARGVDLVDCSSGGLVSGVTVPVGPGYQVPFAQRVRREAAVPTAAVGMITDPLQAEMIVANGEADLVLMARELLRQPRWPLFAAHKLGVTVPWPLPYERAKYR